MNISKQFKYETTKKLIVHYIMNRSYKTNLQWDWDRNLNKPSYAIRRGFQVSEFHLV